MKKKDKKMLKRLIIGSLLSYFTFKIMAKKSNKGIVEFGDLELVGVKGAYFNPERFKQLRKKYIGSLPAINELRELFLAEQLYKYISTGQILNNQAAYIMATAKYEMMDFRVLRELYNNHVPGVSIVFRDREHYFEWKYGCSSFSNNFPLAKTLGNNMPGDGGKYYGRGYVQLTGKALYERFSNLVKVDLVAYPELAVNLDYSAKIIIYGMMGWDGYYFANPLYVIPNYVNEHKQDFKNARRGVNRLDHANEIASNAEKYLKIFNEL